MSFEKLIASAFKDGAGVSLHAVKRSDSYRRRLKRKLALPDRYGPNTHRGIALRFGPLIFGGDVSTQGEKFALQYLGNYSGAVGRKTLTRDALIEELGVRLIKAAQTYLSDPSKESAQRFAAAKSAQEQAALLRGLETQISLAYDARRAKAKDDESESLPLGFEWLESYCRKQETRWFLPAQFNQMADSETPSCLGMSIMLSAWADMAGAKYLYCTEIIDHFDEDYHFQEVICENLLHALRGLPGAEARHFRQSMRRSLKYVRGWQKQVRDWHHGIAVELMDGTWFYLDPYANLAEIFPDEWDIHAVARCLEKYREVVPGMVLPAIDGGHQKRMLEEAARQLCDTLAKAETARYRLSRDPGSNSGLPDLMRIAPELRDLCRVLIANNPNWKKLRIPYVQRLFWLMYAYDYKTGKAVKRSKEEIDDELLKYSTNRCFRQQKLDNLIVQFCRQALEQAKKRGYCIHPALELGNPAFSIGLTVLSNLSSWTDNKAPGTLLLEHGNSQMLWHEAVSPIPELSSLDDRQKSAIALGAYIASVLPRHDLVRRKLDAMKQFLNQLQTGGK